MTPERWQHIKSLLDSALERDPVQRDAFLAAACAGDEALREQVESLIKAHQKAGDFIESPAFELMASSLGDNADSLAGQSLGHYQVISLLGAGGMGQVYLAEDTRLGRKIALKILTTHFTRDSDRLRRFQQEARAASALNHPNILTIHEIGEIDALHFMVTEFIEGETLRGRMAKAQMSTPEALRIGSHIASALAAAHAAGIVHRDIKPENVMLREDGIVKVLDFGLAKLTDQKTGEAEAMTLIKTEQGMVMGTAHYMSPEQARGLPVDARTDIWSLGAVLYEMVGGRVPFEGPTSSDVIAAILEKKPVSLARYAPDVSPELEWIVEKTLRKDREERYQSTKELLTDLRNLKRRLAFVEDLDHLDTGQRSRDLPRRGGSGSHETSHVKTQSIGSSSHNVIDSLAILPPANTSADPGMDYFSDGITQRDLLTKRHIASSEAHRAYLKGRYHWNRRIEESFKKAIDYFNQALEKDPGYPQAYAGLADCYALLSWYSVVPPKDSFPKAKAAALKALELDDTLAEAHTSLAFIRQSYDWDWSSAEVEYKRALELNPGYATAHQWYAIFLSARGRHREAIAEIEYAEELDPLSIVINRDGGWVSYWARQYDRAVAYYQKTFELDPHFYIAHYFLGEVYQQKGDYEKAIAEFYQTRSNPEWSTKIWTLIAHARAHALKVERHQAQQKIDELKSLSKQHYVSPYLIAVIYVCLAEQDQAFDWLEKAFEERDPYLTYLRVEPALDPLRSDPRFRDLVNRMDVPSMESSHPAPFSSERQITKAAKKQTVGSPSHPVLSQPRWNTREAKLFLALGGVFLLVGLGYLLLHSSWQSKEPTGSLGNLRFTQLTFESGAEFFPSLAPDGKSLLYASRAAGNWDIRVQRVGGRNPINLTGDSQADDTQPAFSPDGERIAFRSERDGGGIYLMGATGESITRLSDFGYSPSWSPDGAQILVGTEKIPQPSTRPTKSQLWKIDVKSGERRMISEGDALQPHYSPRQQRIVYWSRPSKIGQRESIWTIPAEGGDAVAVTDGTTTDTNPVWSPDGKFVYFSSNRGGSVNIWRVAIDEEFGAVSGTPEAVTTIGAATSALQLSFGRDERKLAYIAQDEIRNLRKISFDPATGRATGEPSSITRGSMQLWFPDASPDGEWLTCYSMGNQRHIIIMRTDGSELRDLTDDTFRHFWPRWSPDGKRIAFSSRRSGNYELWIINRDGSGLQQLTSGHQSPGAHYSPWSPDGQRIAYSIHAPQNECIIFEPSTPWNEQKLEHLPPLSDSSISFEGWSWSADGKSLAGIKHLPSGIHSGIGVYDMESKKYDWFTDFGDWPVWLRDSRRMLFVSQGKIFLFDTATRKYEPVVTVTDQDVDIGSPSLSPDNKTLYFTFVSAEADIWLMTME